MTKILVTGALGQLGSCIQEASASFDEFECTFLSKNDLDITNATQVQNILERGNYDYCINTSAYTNVELAESNSEEAFLLNAYSLTQLADSCKKSETVLIHLSTDYVFDGKKQTPYTEQDETSPLNFYGASKLKGEEIIKESGCHYFIIRTSWLYSQYGHNFLKTIQRLSNERTQLTVTTEQLGTPTNANDLANAILTIIKNGSNDYGLYHYSNAGDATWYDFAEAILYFTEQLEETTLEKTAHYATFAQRPSYSVLDCSSIKETFGLLIPNWKTSLKSLLLAQHDNFDKKNN